MNPIRSQRPETRSKTHKIMKHKYDTMMLVEGTHLQSNVQF